MNRMIKKYNRREFIRLSASTSAGLTLAMHLPVNAQSAVKSGGGIFDPNAFISIHEDNTVEIIIKHIEFGQGTFTGISTLVAEELDADWNLVQAVHAPADASRYANLRWGTIQGTGGSSAISNSYTQMRQAGAAARQMLVAAAAEKWKVSAGDIEVKDSVVSHAATGKQATFGELAGAASRQPVPSEPTIKSAAEFRLIGKSLPRKDPGKTSGEATFTQDLNLPGQLTAMVAHSPRFGATVASFDASAAEKLPGVEKIVQISSGVAVVAKDYWTAKKGRDLLKIQWNEANAFSMGTEEIMDSYRSLAETPGTVARQDGDVDAVFKSADTVYEATYEYPYLSHSAMEPMNCVAQITESGCELWYGSQIQTMDQNAVAKLLGITTEQVKINTLYAGGSFGRRANSHSDYVLEAVAIAKELPQGTPVKLVWSREDDTRAGYYRPLNYHRVRAALDATGMPLAWEHRIVGQSIMSGTPFAGMVQNNIDPSSVEGARNLPYHIPNMQVELHTPEDINVPVLWWRSVGSTHTAHTTETFIDELAHAAGKDPVDYRMQLLKDHPRHRGVLKMAAEKAGWGKPMAAGRGRGIAVHESFKSFVAEVAEVSVNADGSFSVDRVVIAVDCGVAVNPDVIKAQMEGGMVYGLSAALSGKITLENGMVKESNFHDYQVLRINQMPEVEVHIVSSTESPTGVGEPATPVIAPAVANALFAATGRKYYNLPFA